MNWGWGMGDSMPLSRFGHKAGHGRWGWSGRESSSLTGWNYPSQVVASVTVLCCLPSYHLSSTHQALPFGKLPGPNSYPAPEVGPDWLKPSVPSIPLVHDWFREGHMTQLRPRRGGEMFAGGGGFLGKGSSPLLQERAHKGPTLFFWLQGVRL